MINQFEFEGVATGAAEQAQSKNGGTYVKFQLSQGHITLDFVAFGGQRTVAGGIKQGDRVRVSGELSSRVREYNGRQYTNTDLKLHQILVSQETQRAPQREQAKASAVDNIPF